MSRRILGPGGTPLSDGGAEQWTNGLARALPVVAVLSNTRVVAYLALEYSAATRVCRDCNVVLLTIDTLRADHLECYGYARKTAPNICAAAERNVIFENAISQSNWTKPSMGSLFTSLYPHNHGVEQRKSPLVEEFTTLAETLGSKGYYSLAFQTNPHLKTTDGFDQGFDEYNYQTSKPAHEIAEKFISRARAWMRDGQKIFAYLHFMETHLPYSSSRHHRDRFDRYTGELSDEEVRTRGRSLVTLDQEEDRRHITDLYDAAIATVDESIGRILEFLREEGAAERTIVIILSDHGEEFWDHGRFEHGHTMYNELLHVPVIVLSPQLDGAHRRIPELIRLIDLYPTLMEMLGLEVPPGLLGRNLLPGMLGREPIPELAAYSEHPLYGQDMDSVQTDSHKLTTGSGRLARLGPGDHDERAPLGLFALGADPGEQVNLLDQSPAESVPAELSELLKELRSMGPEPPSAQAEAELDDVTREELRALGYVVDDPEPGDAR